MIIKIGRYWFCFGRHILYPGLGPVKAWNWWLFWLFKEARPSDVDKKPQYPLGAPLEYKGRTYRYFKAGEDINTFSREVYSSEIGHVKSGELPPEAWENGEKKP